MAYRPIDVATSTTAYVSAASAVSPGFSIVKAGIRLWVDGRVAVDGLRALTAGGRSEPVWQREESFGHGSIRWGARRVKAAEQSHELRFLFRVDHPLVLQVSRL